MRWTSTALEEAITDLRARQGGSTDIEVKNASGGVPGLGPTLCAFANMPEGGTIILGLDEASGFTPVGLTSIAELEQAVSDQARTAVTPPARCEFRTFQIAGKAVLVVEVIGLPLPQRPARHGGQAYLRQSDGDYVMSQQELAQLELLKTQAVRPTHPDREAVPSTGVEDLDPDLVSAYVASAKGTSRRYATATDTQILTYTGVLTRTSELSIAGIYALGLAPQAISPSLSITAAVQLPRSPDGPRTRDLVHLVGPIPDLLEEAMNWVVRNTRTTIGYDQRGHGIEKTELPMRAVREIVANALVHRNLDPITDSKRVEIRLLDDRLVISSPGGLWGVSESQLGRPNAKSAVNPVLYDVCKLVRMTDGTRVIEGEGGGIREAIQAMRDAGLRPPRFVDTGLQFNVILSRHTLVSDHDLAWLSSVDPTPSLTSEERSVLVSMRHGETWNNARVRQELGPMDSRDARRILQHLVETGLVESFGERSSTRYAIARDHAVEDPAKIRVEETPDAQPSLLEEQTAPGPSAFTKHGPTLLSALSSPASVDALTMLTGLSDGQVRYALRQLLAEGLVEMVGGPGIRETRYRRTNREM